MGIRKRKQFILPGAVGEGKAPKKVTSELGLEGGVASDSLMGQRFVHGAEKASSRHFGGLIKILRYFYQQSYPFHSRRNCDPENKSSNPVVILRFRGDVRSRTRDRLSTVSVLSRFRDLNSTGMWQGSRDPEVGKRSEKRDPSDRSARLQPRPLLPYASALTRR